MCNTYSKCDSCPAAWNACFSNPTDRRINPDGVVAAVEQWAKDNPQKTRQSEFLKQFQNADLTRLQPCIIEKDKRPTRCIKYIDEVGRSLCDDCRNDYWNEEVTDND
nr:MAG TPA_asm: hypothetical protein [Caudoviricetes sp.]